MKEMKWVKPHEMTTGVESCFNCGNEENLELQTITIGVGDKENPETHARFAVFCQACKIMGPAVDTPEKAFEYWNKLSNGVKPNDNKRRVQKN